MRNLLNFLLKYNYWLLFILLEVICFVLLFRFNNYQQSVFFTSANVVAGKVYEVSGGISSYFHLKSVNEDLLDRNMALEQQITNLENRLKDYRIDSITMNSIRYLEQADYKIFKAHVIRNSLNQADNYITLDKGSSSNNAPQQGADSRVNITITFEESMKGCQKSVTVPVYETCSDCHGTGAKAGTSPETCSYCHGSGMETVVQQTPFGRMQTQRTCSHCHGEGTIIKEKCPKCKGNGYTRQNKEITFDIPKGIAHGQSLRKRGFGGPGKNGGGNGDLYGLISVMPSNVFTRDGDDIYVTVEISMIDAALGAEIVIPTIDGDEKYTVKAGTQPNDMVTLRGKGSYNVRNANVRGNEYVTIKVTVPKSLTEKQKELLHEFKGDAPKKKKLFGK